LALPLISEAAHLLVMRGDDPLDLAWRQIGGIPGRLPSGIHDAGFSEAEKGDRIIHGPFSKFI
jgi:hypothetical protein